MQSLQSAPGALVQMIEPAQWPHQGCVANENLATELAVWALRVARTQQVDALRVVLSQHFPAIAPSVPVDMDIVVASVAP